MITLKPHYYKHLIKLALREDLNTTGDVSTNAVFTGKETGTFRLTAKSRGVLCGTEVFCEAFRQIDKKLTVDFYYADGDILTPGTVTARVHGSIRSILMGERTALNFISHLSGIATRAHELVSIARSAAQNRSQNNQQPCVRILDTRKTLPGYRMLQKYAVSIGGAENHRIGLYDMVMLKDNHIDAAGSITLAVEKVRKRWGSKYKIEVEARTLKDVEEALSLNVDRIMLDNMDNETIQKAIKIINGKIETEASGNMNEHRLSELADSGLTFISFGELTHSVKAFDFSLKHEKPE